MQWQEMDWPVLADPFNDLGIAAVPITLLIDQHGIIRYKNLKGEKLDEAIEKLMAEAGHEVELEEEKKEEVKKEEKDEPQVRATAT